jgi:2,4-dienoyl-CoA reductase-like NADH-dependent reductase (Old Yellow Enzyme family)
LLWGANLQGKQASAAPDRKRNFRARASEGSRVAFTQETAEHVIAASEADAAAFGKLYIANPDLVERFRRKAPLNALNSATIYSNDARGYNDYPMLDTWKYRA